MSTTTHETQTHEGSKQMGNGKVIRNGEGFMSVTLEDGRVHVAMGPRHGQPEGIHATMLTAEQAREFAAALVVVADRVDGAPYKGEPPFTLGDSTGSVRGSGLPSSPLPSSPRVK